MAGRLRASDAEREETVALLSQAAAEGRLGMDELDLRASRAFAAKTRGDLIGLLEDIPSAQLSAREDARAQWRAPAPRVDASVDLIAFVGPLLGTHGYTLQSQTEAQVIFARKRRPAWIGPARFLLPLRLLARLRKREAVTFELHDHGQATTIVASGQAPPEVWHALTALDR